MIDFKEYINEASINAKKRNEKIAFNFLNGGKTAGVHSIGIITAQNPSSGQASNSYNKKANTDLNKYFKQMKYTVIPVLGHFGGNDENSYAVLNISIDELKKLGYKYDQTSFYYVTRDGEKFEAGYWEKTDNNMPADSAKNDYEFVNKTSVKYEDADADGNFSMIGKDYKFTFDTEMFSKANESIMNNLNIVTERYNMTIEEAFDWAYNRTGIKASTIRKIIYGG